MIASCWAILGIAETRDVTEIRRAYTRLLKATSPEDDPDGFQRLRAAYDQARQWAEVGSPVFAMAGFDDQPQAKPDAEAESRPADRPAQGRQADSRAANRDAPSGEKEAPSGEQEGRAEAEFQTLFSAFSSGIANLSEPCGDDLLDRLDALLRHSEMQKIEVHGWVEGYLLEVLSDKIPCTDRLIARAMRHFHWRNGDFTRANAQRASLIFERLDGMRFLESLEQGPWTYRTAWKIISEERSLNIFIHLFLIWVLEPEIIHLCAFCRDKISSFIENSKEMSSGVHRYSKGIFYSNVIPYILILILFILSLNKELRPGNDVAYPVLLAMLLFYVGVAYAVLSVPQRMVQNDWGYRCGRRGFLFWLLFFVAMALMASPGRELAASVFGRTNSGTGMVYILACLLLLGSVLIGDKVGFPLFSFFSAFVGDCFLIYWWMEQGHMSYSNWEAETFLLLALVLSAFFAKSLLQARWAACSLGVRKAGLTGFAAASLLLMPMLFFSDDARPLSLGPALVVCLLLTSRAAIPYLWGMDALFGEAYPKRAKLIVATILAAALWLAHDNQIRFLPMIGGYVLLLGVFAGAMVELRKFRRAD